MRKKKATIMGRHAKQGGGVPSPRVDYPLIAVLSSAFILRLAYFLEFSRSPFADNLILDLAAYDSWGQRIAGGEWIGAQVFYQDPLYPYVLGILYSIFGRHLTIVYLLQIFVGTIACYLVYWITKELFDRPRGILAAGMAAVYQPFIFYEVQVEKSFLAVVLVLAACVLLIRASRRNGPGWWLLTGFCLGLLSLVRGNYLLLVPVVAGAVILVGGEIHRARRVRSAGLILLGTATVLFFTCARNYAVGRDLVLTTSQAGQNFFIGNNPDNLTGMYRAPDFVRADPRFEESDFAREAERISGRGMKPSEVSHFWFRRGMALLESSPGDFIKLLALKAALFWNNYEIPDNLDIYFFRRYSLLLRIWLPSFGFVAALATAGFFLSTRSWRRLWPLYVFVAGYFASVILFYIFSRYRLPVVPFLMVFAAHALLEFRVLLRERDFRRAILPLVAVVVVGASTYAPLVNAYNPSSIDNLGAVLLTMGRLDEAEELFREVLSRRPDFADAHNNQGVVLLRRGNIGAALAEFRETIRLKPRHPGSYVNLGLGLVRQGDSENARLSFQSALELDPRSGDAYAGLGLLYREAGDQKAALDSFRKAADLAPGSADIQNSLGITLLSRGDPEQALQHLRAATSLRLSFAEAPFNLAVCLERLGKREEAIRSYREALIRRPDYSEAYNNLGNLLAEAGDKPGALEAYQNFLKYWNGDEATREAVRQEIGKLRD